MNEKENIMENALQIKEEGKLGTPNRVVDSWANMKDQAQVMIKSGFLPSGIKTAEQCMAIAMTGKELGIGFMEAIRSINVIQGKPTISPQLMLALANRTGELENISIEATKESAIVIVKRKGRKEHKETFGVNEASGLGLIGRDNYTKQPATMFKWRAVAANLRVTFPDVVLGLYTPEELGAEVRVGDDDAIEIIDTKPVDVIDHKPEEPKWEHPADTPPVPQTPKPPRVIPQDPSKVSKAQANRLYAICKSLEWTETDMKNFLVKHGVASGKTWDIPWKQYNQIVEAAQASSFGQ